VVSGIRGQQDWLHYDGWRDQRVPFVTAQISAQRDIVGVLLEAGKGNVSRSDFEARLAPGCAIPAGPTAPARGLFLVGVEY
jgi:tRNA U38,U39,U40 pseudouridine synthase TruA